MLDRKNIILIIVAAMALASPARASLVGNLGSDFHKTVAFTHEGDYMKVSAGEILIVFDNKPLTAYCVDIDHAIKRSWDATSSPVTNINGGLAIAYLYDTFHKGISNDLQAAALQVAIWEVLDDFGGPLSLSAGDFKLHSKGDIRKTAQAFLNAIPTNVSHYQTNSFIVKSGSKPRSQNLIVPEPASLVVLMVPALLFLAKRRSRNGARGRMSV